MRGNYLRLDLSWFPNPLTICLINRICDKNIEETDLTKPPIYLYVSPYVVNFQSYKNNEVIWN